MRRGIAVVCLIGASLVAAPVAQAKPVSKDSDGNVTVEVHHPVQFCTHPKQFGVRVVCYTMTNDEYLEVGPDGIIWTPSHTEDFYDNVTGNHFTGQDPGTLDQPL